MARHHARFYSRGTSLELENSFDAEFQILTLAAQRFTRFISAYDSKGFDARAESSQIRRDVARASEAIVLLFELDDRHSRFRRDAIGRAPKIAIDHPVADYTETSSAHLPHKLQPPPSRWHTAWRSHALLRGDN